MDQQELEQCLAVSDDEFAAFMAQQVEFVNHLIAKGVDSIAPQVAVIGFDYQAEQVDHQVYLVADGFRDDESKYRTLEFLGQTLWRKRFVPKLTALISEAWFAEQSAIPLMPRDNPLRHEGVMVVLMSITADRQAMRTEQSNIEITRLPGSDKLVTVGDWQHCGDVKSALLETLWKGFTKSFRHGG